jgi:hypothetical protein
MTIPQMMEPDSKAALEMLAAFASVGVARFDVTLTDLAGAKVGFRPGRSIDALRQIIPPLLIEATRKQQNLIIRPHKPARAELVQLDDLHEGAAAQIAPFSFMVLSTSPGNCQAWVAVENAPQDFARRLRKGAGADPTASGATRVSGSLNFKTKYAPAFPRVAIAGTNAGAIVTTSALEQAGFVAAPEMPVIPARVSNRVSRPQGGRRRRWPSYARCVQHAPPVHRGEKPDISKADFVWCMTALDWGWSIEDTAARLLQESDKARENGEKYALMTAQNAAAAIARRPALKPSLDLS